MSAYEDILKALAGQQAASFNSSPFSQAVNKDLGEATSSVASALMAPGNALNGQYNDVEIALDGSVNPFNTPMMDAAANMAGVVSLGSAPMPRPLNSLGMGTRLYHGTNQNFDSFDLNAVNASGGATAKEGFWFTNKPEVASEYAKLANQRIVANQAQHEAKTASLLREMEKAESRGDWDRYDSLTQQLEAHEISGMRGEGQELVLEKEVDLKNPLVVDASNMVGAAEQQRYIEIARANGNDGVIFKGAKDNPYSVTPSDQYLVFDPSSIR